MIRRMMTTATLTLGFLASAALSASAAPAVRVHPSKTTIVAESDPAVPATDAAKPQKKADKKVKSEKKANVTKEKGKTKGAATDAAPTAAPVPAPEKTPEKN
jgi:hypothetical protein